MPDIMKPAPFLTLVKWIFGEYEKSGKIFSIPSVNFYNPTENKNIFNIFGGQADTPLGPAAGPHTQLCQNIISAYLTGGRFFELKTVQVLDRLKIDKPCIDARDECYNVEWSQELQLNDSFDEYLKAWILLHLLKNIFNLSKNRRGFIFNMSVGYNLEGIKSAPMDNFINRLVNAELSGNFNKYKEELAGFISESKSQLLYNYAGKEALIDEIKNISANISSSVTLSTMHGCPPKDIDLIARYLIGEKKLNTFIKLNPTLLGYDAVRNMLDKTGFNYVELARDSFEHDLCYNDAVPMISGLKTFAAENNLEFGVKLSNTLGAINRNEKLAGDSMYMSGRSLFPLTVNLAAKLAKTFEGRLKISYSGGASVHNCNDLLKCGIFPITIATDLLKPGGYARLKQISEKTDELTEGDAPAELNADLLAVMAANSLTDKAYSKSARDVKSIKINSPLGRFDCFTSPCAFSCPVHQDISEYIYLYESGKYKEAFAAITSRNPLPFITGYICDHQCMTKCARHDYELPVDIREIKKQSAVKGFPEYLKEFREQYERKQNGISAAVIGAGPAGLSAAYFLAKAGFSVTVFEKGKNAGGTVHHAIPDFRLPQEAIDNDIEFIKMHGVNFVFGSEDSFNIEKLKSAGYKYIFIGIGAGLSNQHGITGEGQKIHNAIEFLREYKTSKKISLGRNVAVIGGGNSAMDGARAAKRINSVENVYILYRRTKEFMPADKEELYAAIDDGVVFRELLLPVEFSDGTLKCRKMRLGETGPDGRRKVFPVDNEFESLEIDSVISAIGEKPENELLMKNLLITGMDDKLKTDNETNETVIENVFTGGDVMRGPSTVIESVADGKKAAEAICIKEGIAVENRAETNTDAMKRINSALGLKGIVKTGNDGSSGCLNCNLLCSKCVDVCPNRANITVKTDSVMFKDEYQIIHLDSFCNECGNCETFCPHEGKPYKDKFTFFDCEDDFKQSGNSGFFVENAPDGGTEKQIKIRVEDKYYKLTFDNNNVVNSNPDELQEKYIALISNFLTECFYLV
jgi:putative selenate reductase